MAYNRWLAHHGVKGQKWGERNGPPYPLNSSISDGHKLIKSDGSPQSKKKYKTSEKTAHKRATRKVKTIFVSGSSKTQDEASGYYRKELPKDIQKQLDDHMRKGNRIIVGDAPGIDRQVQDYLNSKKYRNVEVYGPGKEVRYTANSKWKTNPIDDPDHEPGSKEWLAKKDIAMTEAADEGLAIVLDEGAKATRKNVQRLSEGGKGVRVYSLNKDGNDTWEDDWDRKWNTSYASKDVKKANDIYKTLSKQEKFFLTAEENSKRYVSREEYGKKGTNAYSLIEQYKDTPVSVIDIWKNDRGGADVSIAVRNDSKYRHKGYASRALENGLKYFYDHPEIEYLVWGVNSQNRPSIELAKKYGFYLYDKRDDGWETYTLDQKKEVKHAMAYNRWMYSDELYHHGVKGQKWGERNGPPYPLDSSISTGSKLIKGDGSPQGKKKYKTSEKTAHKRAERKARTESSKDERDYKRLQNFFNRHVGWDDIDAIDHDGRINIELEHLARSVVDGKISKKDYNKRASVIRDEIRKRIDEEAANGSEWAPDTQKRLVKVDKYHRAADEDVYDLDFLENVQNERWYNDKKRMLKEYSDYLQDRDAYVQRGLTPKNTATTQASEPSKKQGSKIEAFKDRLFGNKKSEPVKSEKARTDRELEDAKKRLRELGISKDGIDEFELWSMEVPEKERSKWMQDMVTSTARKSKIKSARDNDMYDLDFLESVQNEHWYNDKKRMLKEYSEYLDDPDKYSRRGSTH